MNNNQNCFDQNYTQKTSGAGDCIIINRQWESPLPEVNAALPMTGADLSSQASSAPIEGGFLVFCVLGLAIAVAGAVRSFRNR
jgi:hypothetical protein